MWLIQKKRKNKDGFTLIELLVAASILGIIGLTILTTFAGGFQVYDRVQAFSGAQAEILFVLEDMEKNIRNLFSMSSIAIVGESQSFAFPAVIEKLEIIDGEEKSVSSIGKISYSFDKGIGEFTRSEWDYSQAVFGGESGNIQTNTIGGIKSVVFSYYSFDSEEEEYSWKEAWSSESAKALAGVKVELVYQRENREVKLSRTVFVPTDLTIKDEVVEEGEGEEEEEGGDGGGEQGEEIEGGQSV